MRWAHVSALALWLLAPACVFPPWDERPGAQGDDDDDDTVEQPSPLEQLCQKFDDCGGSPWETVPDCIDDFPLLMIDCEDYEGFSDCAPPCIEQDCKEFIGCLDACSWNHCYPL